MDRGHKKGLKKSNEMIVFLLYALGIMFIPALLKFLILAPGI